MPACTSPSARFGERQTGHRFRTWSSPQPNPLRQACRLHRSRRIQLLPLHRPALTPPRTFRDGTTAKRSPRSSCAARSPTPSFAQRNNDEDRSPQLLRQRRQEHHRPSPVVAPHRGRRTHRRREPQCRREPRPGIAWTTVRGAAGVPADRRQRRGRRRHQQCRRPARADAPLPGKPRGLRLLRRTHSSCAQAAAGHHRHARRTCGSRG